MSQASKKNQNTAPAQPTQPTKDPNEKYTVKNRYDPYSLKFSLDEYISDMLQKKYQVKQLHKFENIKILLGIVITGVMLLSHFYPLPFPKNFYIVMGCCIGYYILSGIYTYFEERVVKNTFVQFMYPFDKVATAKTKEIKFASKIELFSDTYNLDIQYRPAGDQSDYQEIKNELKVGEYFFDDGKLHTEAVDKFLADTLAKIKGK